MNYGFDPEMLWPPTNLAIPISNMIVNEEGYTIPWAFHTDLRGFRWLDGAAPVFDEPVGTMSLCIRRMPDGFLVDISNHNLDNWDTGTPFAAEQKEAVFDVIM